MSQVVWNALAKLSFHLHAPCYATSLAKTWLKCLPVHHIHLLQGEGQFRTQPLSLLYQLVQNNGAPEAQSLAPCSHEEGQAKRLPRTVVLSAANVESRAVLSPDGQSLHSQHDELKDF